MLVKLFADDEPGGDSTIVDDKPIVGAEDSEDEITEPAGTTVEEPKEQPKTDDTDWKAKAEFLDRQYKELQSGLTPKLSKLAEYERAAKEREAQQDDELADLDKDLARIDQQIPLYKAENLDTTALDASKRTLLLQRKQIIKDRQNQEGMVKLQNFADDHKGFKDYDGLTEIISEAKSVGEKIGLVTAYKIWEQNQKLSKASQSAAINAENRDLGKKATSPDGKLPPEPDETPKSVIVRQGIFGY